MKRLLLLVLLLVCPLIAEAQVTSTPVVFVTVAPTVCQPKKLYSLTTNGNLYERLGSSGTACTLIVNAAGGVISGSGTTNTMTKWTSATALGNALMTDDGSLIVAAVTPTTGNGFTVSGATVTSGNLVSIAASGTAAASNTKTALSVATSGANATNAMTTFGAVISNTSTNGTSGTNVALQLTASGATTANTALNITAGQILGADGTAASPEYSFGTETGMGMTRTSSGILGFYVSGIRQFDIRAAGAVYIPLNTATFSLGTNADVRLSRQADGVLQIGAAAGNATGSLLATNGTFTGTITNAGIASDAATTNNTVCTTTTTNVFTKGSGVGGLCLGTSSARFKNHIQGLTDGLAVVTQLQPKRFFYNKGYGNSGAKESIGFVAEDVQKIAPRLVALDAKGQPSSVDYLGIVPMLVNAIREQQAEIQLLKQQVKSLTRKRKH